MSWRIFISRIFPISSLLLVVLFKFENCAQAPAQFAANGANAQPGMVHLIDAPMSSSVSFISNPLFVSAPAASEVAVQGLCVSSPSDKLIDYQVIDMRNTPTVVMAGQAVCEYGGFELQVANLQLSTCDDRYELRAAPTNDPSHFAITTLQLNCNNP